LRRRLGIDHGHTVFVDNKDGRFNIRRSGWIAAETELPANYGGERLAKDGLTGEEDTAWSDL
jgi:bifunctional DNA-binding transcriptional regulator/antitoxin component of YhaV-PrlF toxin-antitoxin module